MVEDGVWGLAKNLWAPEKIFRYDQLDYYRPHMLPQHSNVEILIEETRIITVSELREVLNHKCRALRSGTNAFIEDILESSPISLALWDTQEVDSRSLEEGRHQNPTMLASWPWTSCRQNWDKQISVVYKLPSLP